MVAAVACAALLIPAVLTAMVTKTGDGAAASPTRLGPNEEFSYLGQGSNESGEAERSAAQEDYENRAYPSATIGFGQTLGAIKAGKKVKDKESKLNAKWKELGPDTLEVGQFGTQNLMVPTQWTGRIAALAVDYKHCRNDECRLYIGSAGGGVWMTNNALAKRPALAREERRARFAGDRLPHHRPHGHERPGNTIYAGTGEENGSSDNEAGLGVYKSTDDGHHWTVLPGSVAAAKDRGVGDIAIDPTDPKHIYIGTMVARHGISSSNGGRFTPPGAPRLGLYESKDGGDTFTLIYSRDQDPVVPGTPTGLDLFRGAISRIQFDPNDPSIFYFTMFNYGAFRANITPAGTTVTQIFTEPNPNPPGPAGLAGIRFELAAAALPGGKTRLYLGEGSDEVGGTPPTVDASKLWRTDDAAAVDGERELDAAVEQDGRHARLQLVRLLPEPVLLRHAGRVAARAAGRGLARRRHAVPGAPVAHGAATARTDARSCAPSTAAFSSRTRRATRGTSSSTSIRTSTRSRSRRAGSRSSPPTAASRARAGTTWTSRPTATRATSPA